MKGISKESIKILLLGITGYLGKHLRPILAGKNNVTMLTRFTSCCNFINSLEANMRHNITSYDRYRVT